MAGQTKSDADEEDRQRFADRALGMLEDAMYWAIALVLVVGSVALLSSSTRCCGCEIPLHPP